MKQPSYLGDAVYECGACHKTQAIPVFECSSYWQPAANCYCEYESRGHILVPQPLNKLAEDREIGYRNAQEFWRLKELARKHMREVNW